MKIVKKILGETTFENKLPLNFKERDRWLFQTHLNTYIHEVKIYLGKNILLLPEHIIVDGFKIWKGEITNHTLYTLKNGLRLRYIFKVIRDTLSRRTKKLKGKYLLITDDWSWSYFHWTADVLQRLYLIKDELINYTVLIPEHFQKYSYIIESLKLFNARIYFFPADKNLRVEELMLPSPVGGSGVFNYNVIRRLSEFIRKHEKVKDYNVNYPEKIYISRGKAKYRKVLNEEEVIKVLKDLGFMILYTEDLSLIQQVKSVSCCKYLVSLHGAGLTNELYLSPEGKVFEIRHPKDYLNNGYYLLATALNLKYYYFLGDSVEDDPHFANISVEITSFRESITKFVLT